MGEAIRGIHNRYLLALAKCRIGRAEYSTQRLRRRQHVSSGSTACVYRRPSTAAARSLRIARTHDRRLVAAVVSVVRLGTVAAIDAGTALELSHLRSRARAAREVRVTPDGCKVARAGSEVDKLTAATGLI